jgi:putative hydrolase of the HAD superfamily
MTAYRWLLLDFGGVVTSDFHGELTAFGQRECGDPTAIAKAFATPEGRAALAGAEDGTIPQREFEVVLGKLLGLGDGGLLARVLGGLRPRPEVLGLAARARSAGVKTAILSNSWGSGAYDPYDGWHLDRLFDAVVISDQVGLRKPDAAIYELTAAKIGLPPADCLFVDDTERNLPTARELGMGILLFTGASAELEEISRLTGLS